MSESYMPIIPDPVKAARLEAASRILSGLLASGHFTELVSTGDGAARCRSWNAAFVIEETITLLEKLERRLDEEFD